MSTGNEKSASAAIVLAAGHGTRMHSDVPKQFLLLDQKPLICYALQAFEESGIGRVILVTGADTVEYCRTEIVERYGFSKVCAVVPGGKERYHSVYAGLCTANDIISKDGIILIHDGARPFLTQEIIGRTAAAAREFGACVAAMPVKDTIKISDPDGFSAATLDRKTLWQIQTPQAFRYSLVKYAYDRMIADAESQAGITDDAMVVEAMTETKVKLVEGSYNNIKVTTPEDMVIAEGLLRLQKSGGRQE